MDQEADFFLFWPLIRSQGRKFDLAHPVNQKTRSQAYESQLTLSNEEKMARQRGTTPFKHDKTVPFIAPFYRQLAELGVAIGP